MARTAPDPLKRYTDKRNFAITSEPAGVRTAGGAALSFVVQKHWASRLHYDFRLELDGVLLSWALPKGLSFDPKEKRMAVHVEDHPVSYGSFEGTIPPKQYGAGTVIVWDRGTWEPVGDARAGLAAGKLVFHLHGEKLAGLWELVRIAKPGDKQDPWMLFKKRDGWARPLADYDVITALPDSVIQKPLGLLEEREQAPGAVRSAVVPRPSEPDLAQARKARLPAKLAPQLATLASEPPSQGHWICETKFDGYRLLARIESGRVQLFTRNGNDWTDKMPTLAAAVAGLGIDSAWLDGEIVVMNDSGIPDFNALQNAIDGPGNDTIEYFVFDVPYLGGFDLRAVPLVSRQLVLQGLLGKADSPRVRISQAIDAAPGPLLQAACNMKLEGIIVKRADAPYVSERAETWLKLKCEQRQEFVVCGFVDRAGANAEVGSLVLGYNDGATLRYAGNVGTGWSSRQGGELHGVLARIKTDQPPFEAASVKPGRWSRRVAGSEQWVKPVLVAEVAFSGWTPEGHVRHPVFKGLRSDKSAGSITREVAVQQAPPAAPRRAATAAAPKITNPDRVIDPSTGLRKLDLVHYYESIGDWLLPHLKDRPVSLVRAPQGITGELFFQKHLETRMPGLKELDPALWPGHTALLAVDSQQALMAAAQMNVVEFHTWNSKVGSIDKPDRVIFDLDPGEGVGWVQVKEAALLTRTLLGELGLQCWLKTSGGKGLHVVLPLTPRLDYDTVKDFSQAAVQHLARTIPSRFVARSGPANRVGKIFVDYLRNGHAQTTASAFSARARPGMGVSMPVAWEQLPELKSGAMWTIATAREYLSFQKADPWAAYWKTRQTTTAAMRLLASSR